MWHEARKQEKVVRKVIVDYRKRAERRHQYYDKIKQDPTKFMQIHGKRLKLNIDENGLLSDSSSHMVPWQGDKANMIDRFDVRAHLDYIRDPISTKLGEKTKKEEAKLNYERYRILVYNKHKSVSETQHLQKIHINETYPELSLQKQEAELKKQQLAASKTSIGFDYGDDGGGSSARDATNEESDEDSDLSSEDEEFLTELEEIPTLRELNSTALQDLEKHSLEFGMGYTDFVRSMDQDQNMQEQADAVKAIESEKLKMAGKKSRRERRVLKDQRLRNRVIGPLSYVQQEDAMIESESESESSDTDEEKNKDGQIEFITSFGDNNASQNCGPTPSAPYLGEKQTVPKRTIGKSRSRSRSRRSRSRDRHRRSRSRSRGYARSRRDLHSRRHRSSSRDKSRSRSRDRAWKSRDSKSDNFRRRRSESRERRSKSRDRRSRSRGRRSRSRERRSRSRSRSRDRRSLSRERSPPKSSTISSKLSSTSKAKASISAGGANKKLTPQERLKLKMQRALKKQLKADKIAMADKREQMFNEQRAREEELREMARKMRRREEDRYDRNSPLRRSSYR